MRQKIVAGNWKMNLTKSESIALLNDINEGQQPENVQLIVFPPAVYLDILREIKSNCAIGAQNFHPAEKGAFTGENSVSQVQDAGATYVLVGHSERRMYFNEDGDFLKDKVDAALAHGLKVIFCCGEPLSIRELEHQNQYVSKQLEESLFHLSALMMQKIVVAYEPIWAIGTGKTASSAQAENMHAAIRQLIAQKYNQDLANQISILYGGSCNGTNADELFACENVDGGLIGGASLKAADFLTIANSF
jgi:triosephosphate isomerase